MEDNLDFSYDSRDIQINSFKDYKNLVEFTGYSLSFILFLISALNFTNIIATDILKNKKSLSTIEAIGMTKKDIGKYLVKKNLTYLFTSLALSIVMMVLFDKFILKDFIEAMVFTSFSLVIIPLIMVNLLNIIIGILFSLNFYKSQTGDNLIDRIRNL